MRLIRRIRSCEAASAVVTFGPVTANFHEFRTYALGVLSLRQSGTLQFSCVRISALRAEIRTQKKIKRHAAAGKKSAALRRGLTQLLNS